LELDICGLDRLLVLAAVLLFGLPGIAAAPAYPTAVLVTPLARETRFAGMFRGLAVVVGYVNLADQTGNRGPSHGPLLV
jgi:hypothetical protein